MPAPFSPVHIPFISGARQDLGKIAQSPSQLREALNVVFTKKGHITGRPGLVSRDAQVEVDGQGGTLSGSLGSLTATSIPCGIVSTSFSSSGGDTPLACWQGHSYYNHGSLWVNAGDLWSLRQTKSAVLLTYDPVSASRAKPVPVGQDLVGVITAGGGLFGFPILNSSGEVSSVSLGPTAQYTDANPSIAGNALVFIDTATGTCYAHIPGTLPAMTQVTVGTGASTSTSATQKTWSVLANDGFYYIAYASSTAGRITLVRMNSAGTVTQTLNVNGLGTVQSLGLVHDGGAVGLARLGLAWTDTAAGPAMKTKIFTIIAGTMADAAIDLTLSGTPLNLLGLDFGSMAVGVTHNSRFSVLYTNNAGSLYVGGRLFSAATEVGGTALVANGLGNEKEWDPLFGAVVVGGRTLIGVLNSMDVFNQSSQWIVLDATNWYTNGDIIRQPVAAGPYLGAARMTPSSVYSNSTSVSFAVAEGIQFSASERPVSIIRRAGIRRITLSLQGVQATHANGTTLLSGQYLHVFDGVNTRLDHFVEEMPFIYSGTAASGGGSLPAGSFTYQATWEAVNARGQVIRSGASNQKTVTVTLNQKVTVVVGRPSLRPVGGQIDLVRIRLWATKVNPTSTSPLYLVAELLDTTPNLMAPVSIVNSTEPVGTEEQLYETTDTLSDMHAPCADRGVAYVNERVWVADQNKLYASKLIKPGIATSWNTEGPHTITLPSTLGTVQALAALEPSLVVVCSRGVALVTGPGVDDTGTGQGWITSVINDAPGAGESSPRSVATVDAGVAYQTQDGDLWVVDQTGQALPISRPLRDNAVTGSPVDVVHLASTKTTNDMLVAHGNAQYGGVLRVLDIEAKQWCTWTFPGLTPSSGLFIASISGVLWVQTASQGVWSANNSVAGQDAGVDFTARIETGTLKPKTETPRGWGRIRSVVLNEVRAFGDSPVDFFVTVFADQNDRILLDKQLTTGPSDNLISPDGTLEFRTTVQRCAYARVLMVIDPAVFNIEGLDLWVANTGENTPSNKRS